MAKSALLVRGGLRLILMTIAMLTISVDGNGSAVDDAGLVAREKQDNAGDVFGFGPLVEGGGGHGLTVDGGVDDAGEDGVDADAGAFGVGGEGVHEGYGCGFGGCVGGCSGSVIEGGFGGYVDYG